MITEATAILKVAHDLWSLITGADKALRERKQQENAENLAQRGRAADYFINIAEVLEHASAQLKQKAFPSGSCAQLLAHAHVLPDMLAGVVGASDLAGLQSRLFAAHHVEHLHAQVSEVSDPVEITSRLSELDASAGVFRAIAAQLRL